MTDITGLAMAIVFFTMLTGLFLYGTIYYRRRLLQEERVKKDYRNLFRRLRDFGMEGVIRYANESYSTDLKYLEEIRKCDEHYESYSKR